MLPIPWRVLRSHRNPPGPRPAAPTDQAAAQLHHGDVAVPTYQVGDVDYFRGAALAADGRQFVAVAAVLAESRESEGVGHGPGGWLQCLGRVQAGHDLSELFSGSRQMSRVEKVDRDTLRLPMRDNYRDWVLPHIHANPGCQKVDLFDDPKQPTDITFFSQVIGQVYSHYRRSLAHWRRLAA